MNNSKKDEKIIMYDSDEAASLKTITGWVANGNGQYWGNDENMARWAGCTHINCECGRGIHTKAWTKCDQCIREGKMKRYLELPYEEFDGTFPLIAAFRDEYFWNEDDLQAYFENFDEEDQPESILLLHCLPQYASQIGFDHWQDVTPEDHDNIGDKKFEELLNQLNSHIAAMPPVSWRAGKTRTEYFFKSE